MLGMGPAEWDAGYHGDNGYLVLLWSFMMLDKGRAQLYLSFPQVPLKMFP